MPQSKTNALGQSLIKASAFLERALSEPTSEIQRAASIQAFEFSFELAWKLLQSRLRDEGISVASPRAAFRAAGDTELVPSVERWFAYLDARNLTAHTYNEATAQQVYDVVAGGFLDDVRRLLAEDPD